MVKEKAVLMEYAPATLASLLFLSQIAVGAYLLSWVSQIVVLAYVGVGLYVFSGLIFGMLPVYEFRKSGGVGKGTSYIHTTRLVETGIYSVVRHPQYVTFMLWAIAGMLLFQHWMVILLGVPVFPLTYIDLIKADRDAMKKLGDDYKAYMKRVPRANFLLGLLRLARRRSEHSEEHE
jgi:protein-S-isoprenylcysteine O-methyltransferase Ste14